MESKEIKEMTLEDKTEYYRSLLKNLDNGNECDLFNLYVMIDTYNVFDDSFFNNEKCYLKDISEFIDIKLALRDELEAFNETLITWYLSALASCDAKRDMEESEFEEMPLTIKGIFSCATISVLSSIMNKIDLSMIDLTMLHNVKGAFTLVAKLFNNHSFIADCMDKI